MASDEEVSAGRHCPHLASHLVTRCKPNLEVGAALFEHFSKLAEADDNFPPVSVLS
jgi:hypothetical protein